MNNTDNTDGRKVDWDKPIEAVHTDGHTAAVEPAAVPLAWGMVYGGEINGQPWGFDKFGFPVRAICPWRIRNVATPQQAEQETVFNLARDYAKHSSLAGIMAQESTQRILKAFAPAVPQEVVERMVKLLREYAGLGVSSMVESPSSPAYRAFKADAERRYAEARAIVAMLEPVDPDLVAAREIAKAIVGYEGGDEIGAGSWDDANEVQAALQGIRTGRALAKEAGE